MAARFDRRVELIDSLGRHLLRSGLGDTGLRSLASAVGTSDRMLLYYFRDKAELLDVVLGKIAADLAQLLDREFNMTAPLSPAALYVRLSQLAASPAVSPFMQLWTEIAAAGGRGQPPFRQIAASITLGFQAWVETRLDVPDPLARKGLASLLLVLVDGGAVIDSLDDRAIGDAARAKAEELLAKL